MTVPARILRVGLVVDGTLRDQRLIPRGDRVSVGPEGTLAAPLAESRDLFESHGGVPVLCITADTQGRISGGEGAVRLADLRRDPAVTRRGDTWLLPLSERDTGRVDLGEGVVVLFQMAPPPPTPHVLALPPSDFRPRWLEDDDPLFLGGLGSWAALAGVFAVIAAHSTPAPMDLDTLPEAVRKKVFLPEQVVAVVEPPPEPEAPKPEPKPEPEAVAEVVEPEPEPADARTEAMRAERIKERVVEQSATIAFIRGRHEGGKSPFDGADDALAEIDALTDDLDDKPIGTGSDRGPRDGTGTTDDEDIEVTTASTGNTTVGPTDTPTFTLTLPPPDAPPSTDTAAIRAAIDRQQGALTYCFTQAARTAPDLSGRVVVELAVADGRPDGVAVIVNTTGHEDFGQCIRDKIRRWSFHGADTDGDFIEVPFVFSPK
ncbi:MAG: hypothetical protein EP330_17945 [Deltaproteobacteria bacterium]|nr:MAG: hypothetical protein EP330_17945 [Deltaproteobacteria bacterium]